MIHIGSEVNWIEKDDSTRPDCAYDNSIHALEETCDNINSLHCWQWRIKLGQSKWSSFSQKLETLKHVTFWVDQQFLVRLPSVGDTSIKVMISSFWINFNHLCEDWMSEGIYS